MFTNMNDLTHIDDQGRARMVDVGHKPPLRRTAVAAGELVARRQTLDRLLAGDLPKGDALAVARVAGIAAVYSSLFGTGKLIFGEWGEAAVFFAIAGLSFSWIARNLKRMPAD